MTVSIRQLNRTHEPRWHVPLKAAGVVCGTHHCKTMMLTDVIKTKIAVCKYSIVLPIEQHVLDTYAGKQLSSAATDV